MPATGLSSGTTSLVPRGGNRWWLLGIVLAALLATALYPAQSQADSSSRVVQVTKKNGIKRIGDLFISRGMYPTNFWDAKEVFGQPGLVRRPYREGCEAFFGKGLMLGFVSFGLVNGCDERLLHYGKIRSRYWKVKVGKRLYRVGMPKRRVPRNAKFVKRNGYQLASIRFVGGRIGSVYAKIGGKKRIRGFELFIGLAGD